MRVTAVKLRDFRNYAQALFAPDAGITVLTGENAQGKTNLLEALYVCCLGRSHRTPHDRELIRWGAEAAHVRVALESRAGQQDIAVGIAAQGTKRKIVRIGGKPVQRIGDLMGHLHGVLFSPEDLRVVKEGPGERRRFVDMELSQLRPAYFFALQRYVRALGQRNGLLRQLAAHGDAALRRTLDTWDEQLAQAGAEVIAHRAQFIALLRTAAQPVHDALTAGREKLTMRYDCALGVQGDVATHFLEQLRQARALDMRRMTTSVGPHRDELRLCIDGREARVYGSQGQLRTVALSLKLAELDVVRQERGETPLLLLGDVMSELDPGRRRLLLSHMQSVQTIVTCTHVSDLGGAACGAVYRVAGGTLERA